MTLSHTRRAPTALHLSSQFSSPDGKVDVTVLIKAYQVLVVQLPYGYADGRLGYFERASYVDTSDAPSLVLKGQYALKVIFC